MKRYITVRVIGLAGHVDKKTTSTNVLRWSRYLWGGMGLSYSTISIILKGTLMMDS